MTTLFTRCIAAHMADAEPPRRKAEPKWQSALGLMFTLLCVAAAVGWMAVLS